MTLISNETLDMAERIRIGRSTALRQDLDKLPTDTLRKRYNEVRALGLAFVGYERVVDHMLDTGLQIKAAVEARGEHL